MAKKGVKIWTCDGCGKRETWRKGWHYFDGVVSLANGPVNGNWFPLAACSDACGDEALKRAVAAPCPMGALAAT